MPLALMASGIESGETRGDVEDGVGPDEDERGHEPADPHPDYPDDFDDDVACRESEEAVVDPGSGSR